MQKIRTEFRKVLYKIKNDWLNSYNVIFIISIIMCFVWTASAIKATSRNWTLERTLLEKNYEKDILELEVANLELENKYYSSKEYQELSARRKLNKKLPDEKMVYLPSNSDEAKSKHEVEEVKKEKEENNLAEWLKFLFKI